MCSVGWYGLDNEWHQCTLPHKGLDKNQKPIKLGGKHTDGKEDYWGPGDKKRATSTK